MILMIPDAHSAHQTRISGWSVAGVVLAWPVLFALFNPKTSILIQKRHPYTGNLNSEMPGDSKNAFLHYGLSRVDSV